MLAILKKWHKKSTPKGALIIINNTLTNLMADIF